MHQPAKSGAGQPALARSVDEITQLFRLTDRLYRTEKVEEVFDAALDAIRATLGCDRASILLFDADGVMRFVAWRGLSEDYRRIVDGHTPWRPGERDPRPIFVGDIAETDEPDWLKAALRKEDIRGLAFIPLTVRGGVVGKFMTYYRQPHTFTEHETELAVTIARQVGFSLDRARAEEARNKAEEDLRRSEERFRLMSENAPVMIWMSKADGSCLHLNKLLRTFWGVAEEDIESFDWTTMMHPEDAPEIGRTMGEAIARRERVSVKGRYFNAAGEVRHLQTDALPRISATGEFLGMIGVNVDMTEREIAEQQREILLAELNHRVKNTLAVVQSIAQQTFNERADPTQARVAFQHRLGALAAAHDLLMKSDWQETTLEELAEAALQPASRDDDRLIIGGPTVRLTPSQAVSFAIVLHELNTNALKYGALSTDRGTVHVSWTKQGDGAERLALIWEERDGPAVAKPARRGFGSRLIERMLRQDAESSVEMDFRPTGLICRIDIPLDPPGNT